MWPTCFRMLLDEMKGVTDFRVFIYQRKQMRVFSHDQNMQKLDRTTIKPHPDCFFFFFPLLLFSIMIYLPRKVNELRKEHKAETQYNRGFRTASHPSNFISTNQNVTNIPREMKNEGGSYVCLESNRAKDLWILKKIFKIDKAASS